MLILDPLPSAVRRRVVLPGRGEREASWPQPPAQLVVVTGRPAPPSPSPAPHLEREREQRPGALLLLLPVTGRIRGLERM